MLPGELSGRRITTPRLTLRPLAMEDAPALHRWLSDPAVMRYWSTLPHKELAETERWVSEGVKAQAAGTAHEFAVLHEGELIGRIAFWNGPEIGFLFSPEHQGKGYASEALKAVIAYAFEDLGFTEIRADVDPGNEASLRLLERNGFVRTGYEKNTFEIGGRFFDSVYLTLRKN